MRIDLEVLRFAKRNSSPVWVVENATDPSKSELLCKAAFEQGPHTIAVGPVAKMHKLAADHNLILLGKDETKTFTTNH